MVAVVARPGPPSRLSGTTVRRRPRPGPHGAPAPIARRTAGGRRLGWALIGGAAALVPWMWMLAATMPSTTTVSNWSAAWLGLDAMEAAALLGTGVLLVRRDPRHGLGAAAAATLLTVDAWFDVMTAAPGAERAMAIALAAGVELPVAALCAVLAARALRPRGPVIDHEMKDRWQRLVGSTPDG
ncbi:hypothetical protein GCM10010402_09350 [Actinomadura luteofluorescens]|uniref:hypothetical protein n=1 Tax=Actinomadura luteofluorescens TaxID=46163 RepID=UPI0021641320|nr:hypothetical protein [Actinomadura glauciflava]MCR3738483.1 hypothetical protein [Actinomadura glauciflava]